MMVIPDALLRQSIIAVGVTSGLLASLISVSDDTGMCLGGTLRTAILARDSRWSQAQKDPKICGIRCKMAAVLEVTSGGKSK